MNFEFYMPTKVLFGEKKLDELGKMKLNFNQALIVTGGNSTTRLGYVERVQKLLKKNNINSIVYKDIQPNPTKKNVEECAELCKQNKVDVIVALGGGSSIDAAKACSFFVTNGGDLWDYFNFGSGGKKEIKNKPLPLIAITTTAGTGSEADPWYVITNEKGEKQGGGCQITFPFISIVDPELMYTVPPKYTAFQGFDAFFHSVEGYIANIASEMSDIFALRAVELLAKYLPIAVKDGSNKEARAKVAFANTIAGFVETVSSCTSEHSIEHGISGFFPAVTHGAGLIAISVAYHKTFANVCEDRYAELAKKMGYHDATGNKDFIKALINLQKQCNVDRVCLKEFGIQEKDIKPIVENSFYAMEGLFNLDRKKLTQNDVENILRQSL